jgi:hypothetical protein
MSNFNDKINKSIADAVTKIMQQEATHPKTEKEKDLAAMGHPKDKITHKDVLIGRGVLKKEEAEQVDEGLAKMSREMLVKASKREMTKKELHPQYSQPKFGAEMLKKDKAAGNVKYVYRQKTNEEVESCEDEAEEAVEKHEKKMHGKKGEVSKHEKEMHKESYSFTSLIESYKKDGLKSLGKMKKMKEEVDSETYEKEMKDQKDKFDGKKKGGDVAKASVQAVKQEETHTEIQVIDMTDANNIKKKTIDITEAEKMKGEDPCWKDYEMVGMKMKNGKKVPNCVPKNEAYEVMDANDVNGVTIDTIKEEINEELNLIILECLEHYNLLDESFKDKLKNAAIIGGAAAMVAGHAAVGAHNLHTQYHTLKNLHTASKTIEHKSPEDASKIKHHIAGYIFSHGKAGAAHLDSANKIVQKHNVSEEVELEERTLTEPEAKKKEEIVMSMKKKLSGFKDRYGDRAKEVMYATATARAKEKA